MPDPKFPLGSKSRTYDKVQQIFADNDDFIRRLGNASLPPANHPTDSTITSVGLWRQIQAQEINHMASQLGHEQDGRDLSFNARIEDSFIPDANMFLGFPQARPGDMLRVREQFLAQEERAGRTRFGLSPALIGQPLPELDEQFGFARDPRSPHNRSVERLFTALRDPNVVSGLTGLDQEAAVKFSTAVDRFIPGLRQAQPWVPAIFGVEQTTLPGGLTDEGLQGFGSIDQLAVDRAARSIAQLIGVDDRSAIDTIRIIKDQLNSELAPDEGFLTAGVLAGFGVLTAVTEFGGGAVRDPIGVASSATESDISGTPASFSGMFEFGRQQGRTPSGITVNTPLGEIDIIREGAFFVGDPLNFLPVVGFGTQLSRGLSRSISSLGRKTILKEGEFLPLTEVVRLGKGLGMTDDDLRMFMSPIGGEADIEDPVELLLAARNVENAVQAERADSIMRATEPLRERPVNMFGGADLPTVDNLVRTRDHLDNYFGAVDGRVTDDAVSLTDARQSAQSDLLAGDTTELVAIRREVDDRLETEFAHLAGPHPADEAAFAAEQSATAIDTILREMRFGINRIAGSSDLGELATAVQLAATAQGRDVFPAIIRYLDFTDRGLPRMFPDAVLEKIGQIPIAREMLEGIRQLPLLIPPKFNRLAHMSYVAASDNLRADILRADSFIDGWITRADDAFGGLDDAILATPKPGTEHSLSGKLADVIENKDLYDLTPKQLVVLGELQRFLGADLDLTRAFGADWGRIERDYISHIYDPTVDQQLIKSIRSGNRAPSGFQVRAAKERSYPTLRDAVDASDDLSARVQTNVEGLLRARFLSSARARADLQASEVLKSMGRTKSDDTFTTAIRQDEVFGLEGFFFKAEDAADIIRLYDDRTLSNVPVLQAGLNGLDTLRQTVLSVDGSFMSIQGLLGFMARPIDSIQAIPAAAQSFMSTSYWNQWMSNNGAFLEWASRRGFRTTLGETSSEFSADVFARLSRTHPKLFGADIGGPQRAFGRGVWAVNQRGFGRSITVQRAAILRKNLETMGFAADHNIPHFVGDAKRISTNQDPEFLAREAIRNVNEVIPMINFEELALSKTRQRLERVPFISPSYWRAPQMFAKDLVDFKSPRGKLARITARNAVVTGYTMAISISMASGFGDKWQDIIDPTSRDFMTAFTPWGKVRLGGPFRSMWRMVSPTTDLDEWFAGVTTGIGYKFTPGIDIPLDLIKNEDFFGNEILEGGVSTQFLQGLAYFGVQSAPLPLQAIKESVDDGLNVDSFLANMTMSFVGASFSPYSPFFESSVQLGDDQQLGLAPRERPDGSPVNTISDLSPTDLRDFNQRHPDLEQARLESGTSEFAESSRLKDQQKQSTVTSVQSHFQDFLDTAAGSPETTITTARDLADLLGDELLAIAKTQVGIDLGLGIDHESNLTSTDPLERAVAEYYDIVINQAGRGAGIDAAKLDTLLSAFDARLTPEQREWVDLSNARIVGQIRLDIPAADIYYTAKEKAINSGFLDIDETIWAQAQQAFGNLGAWDTFDDYLFATASTLAQGTNTSVQAMLSQGLSNSTLNDDPVIAFISDQRKVEQEPMLIADPQLAGALLLLGWRQSFSQELQVGAAAWLEDWITQMRTAGTEVETDEPTFEPTLGNVGPQAPTQDIIRLRAEGMSHRDIAEETGASVDAVKSALFRQRSRTGDAPSPTT